MIRSQEQILSDFKLRATPSRSDILTMFIQQPHALSPADIEREVSARYDRVTVYRTLKTFLDKGMIHKVLDDSGAPKYALCSATCLEEHHHNHVHFKCSRCGQTNCLETIEIPIVSLPDGYRASEVSLLIRGICKICE